MAQVKSTIQIKMLIKYAGELWVVFWWGNAPILEVGHAHLVRDLLTIKHLLETLDKVSPHLWLL